MFPDYKQNVSRLCWSWKLLFSSEPTDPDSARVSVCLCVCACAGVHGCVQLNASFLWAPFHARSRQCLVRNGSSPSSKVVFQTFPPLPPPAASLPISIAWLYKVRGRGWAPGPWPPSRGQILQGHVLGPAVLTGHLTTAPSAPHKPRPAFQLHLCHFFLSLAAVGGFAIRLPDLANKTQGVQLNLNFR